MKILFLTLVKIASVADEGIYMDLMKCFASNGHDIYIVSPLEKKDGGNEEVISEGNIHLLRCKTGNLFGVGMITKGISQTLLPFRYSTSIEKYFSGIKFDLILYSTPPVSLADIVAKIKQKTDAKTYLLLKDIFPQNAVDIGLLSPFMAKILFRHKEKKLYEISDYIGCMSPANVEFLLKHNEIDRGRVEVCPNSIQVETKSAVEEDRSEVLSKYNIPENKTLFLYGGNLGLPQDIPFIIKCMEKASAVEEAHFVICGNGTEYCRLAEFIRNSKPKNLTLIKGLPKTEYDRLAGVCDVGMIFLDHRFTIPNFPSRLLSYLKEKMPILACTDENTDLGRIVVENEFGLSSVSDNTVDFVKNVKKLTDKELRIKLGKNGYKFLVDNYTVEESYKIIMRHFED